MSPSLNFILTSRNEESKLWGDEHEILNVNRND